MAKAKRNLKTHPKNDGDPESYVAPDRPELLGDRSDESPVVIDIMAKPGKGEVAAEDDAGVDRDSADEGDGATAAREGDDGQNGDRGRTRSDARGSGRSARGGGSQGDDDDTSYSRKVRQRVARERAVANRERVLREQTQKQLTDERAARAATEERLARLERAQTDIAGNADVKAIEGKIEALKTPLAAAVEAGETAKVLDLQMKIGDLQSQLAVLKYDLKKQQEAATAAAAAARGRAATDTGAVTDRRAGNAVAKVTSDEFIAANKHWWRRTKNQEAKQDCIDLDNVILDELEAGDLDFEEYSDEHFEELARRLHKEHPDLELCDLEGEPYNFDENDGEDMNERDRRGQGGRNDQRRQSGGRSPTGGIGKGGRRGPTEVDLARRGQVRLGQEDFNQMRVYGLDPKDPLAKKYFAKERARSILTDDSRGNR